MPVQGAIPRLPGIEMYGNSIPAGTVGGDLFEYINCQQRYDIDARIQRAVKLSKAFLEPLRADEPPGNSVDEHVEWLKSRPGFRSEMETEYRTARSSEQVPEILENADQKLTARMLDFVWHEWKHLQLQIESLSEDLEKIASSDAACVRLQQIPGVGPLVPTAVVSAIGNGAAFHKGREFAAWLGLVPGQWSTGGKGERQV
jgi:transposase